MSGPRKSRPSKSRMKSRRGAPWTFADLKRLGKTADSVLARLRRRTIKEVVAMREHLRIALETGPRRWTMREIGLLGKKNDYELSRRFRRPKYEVHAQRRALGIPPFKPRPEWRYWEAWEKELLGTMRDEDLAQDLGRTFYSVQVERLRCKIPVFNNTRKWKEEHLRLLGTAPDQEVAKMTGYSVSAVHSMRLKHTTVRFRRGGPRRPRRLLRVWTEQEKALLKELSDREMAERLGSSLKSIRRARREFGIRREIWPRARKRGP